MPLLLVQSGLNRKTSSVVERDAVRAELLCEAGRGEQMTFVRRGAGPVVTRSLLEAPRHPASAHCVSRSSAYCFTAQH